MRAKPSLASTVRAQGKRSVGRGENESSPGERGRAGAGGEPASERHGLSPAESEGSGLQPRRSPASAADANGELLFDA